MEGDSLQPLKVTKAVHGMDSLFIFHGSRNPLALAIVSSLVRNLLKKTYFSNTLSYP